MITVTARRPASKLVVRRHSDRRCSDPQPLLEYRPIGGACRVHRNPIFSANPTGKERMILRSDFQRISVVVLALASCFLMTSIAVSAPPESAGEPLEEKFGVLDGLRGFPCGTRRGPCDGRCESDHVQRFRIGSVDDHRDGQPWLPHLFGHAAERRHGRRSAADDHTN